MDNAKIKKNIKAIFLDVDGVLNCLGTKERFNGYLGIEDEKVSLLAELVKKSKANILLTSSWKEYWHRKNKEKQDSFANYLDAKLAKYGLVISLKTMEENPFNRGVGIKEMIQKLDQLDYYVSHYAIFDDQFFDYIECGLEDKLIKTDDRVGLTKAHILQAEKLLNN